MAKKKTETEAVEKVVEDRGPEARAKAADVALKSLSKKFGDKVVGWLSDTPQDTRTIIPTGSLRLDAALGVGGITLGRFWELYGPQQSGKTTLAFSVMNQAIKMGHRCIFVDAEHSLDKGLLVKMGMDLSKVAFVDAYTAEEILDATEALISTGEFGVCVIDSVGALQPTAEADLESFNDNPAMGLHPRLMSRVCRTFVPLAARTNTGMLLINQIRTNLGAYGAPETTPGGNALSHAWSGRIRVSGGAVKSRQIKNSEGDAVGHKVRFEITKNKLAVPFREAEVDLIWGDGFQLNGEIVDLAVEMGFIDQAGAWFSYNGEKIGQGRDNAVEYVSNNKELRKELLTNISKMLGFSVEAYT
jgi:recombination protein RecA